MESTRPWWRCCLSRRCAARLPAPLSGVCWPIFNGKARFHPLVVGDVRRHLDLRRHAFVRVEPVHVFPDGRLRRRSCCRSPMRCLPKTCPPSIAAGAWSWWAASARLVAILPPAPFLLCCSPSLAGGSCGFSIYPRVFFLVALSPMLPESARFLQHMGRVDEARAVLARFGAVATPVDEVDEDAGGHAPLPPTGFGGTTTALTLLALSWGLVNFGLLLWLPSELVAEGNSVALSSTIIAKSTLLAAPTILIAAWLYSAWSTKGAFIRPMAGITGLGLAALLLRGAGLFPVLSQSCPAHRSSDLRRVRRDLDAAALHIGKLSGKSTRTRHRLGGRLQQDRRPHGPGVERPGSWFRLLA